MYCDRATLDRIRRKSDRAPTYENASNIWPVSLDLTPSLKLQVSVTIWNEATLARTRFQNKPDTFNLLLWIFFCYFFSNFVEI